MPLKNMDLDIIHNNSFGKSLCLLLELVVQVGRMCRQLYYTVTVIEMFQPIMTLHLILLRQTALIECLTGLLENHSINF